MLQSERDNLIRWDGKGRPFYEVYYLKLNEPSLGAALWLRYTFLSPLVGDPEASVWAISGDVALKKTFTMSEVVYRRGGFDINIGGSVLNNSSAAGEISGANGVITWDINWTPSEKTFRHLPSPLYYLPWPSTKVVAPNLSVPASGWFSVDGIKYDLGTARLHQGHVWGRGYSERWAWANCCVFREDKSAVFELLMRPPFGLGYLRVEGKKMRFRVKGSYSLTAWEFEGLKGKIVGQIRAIPRNITAVTYYDPRSGDPSGGERYCYNTNVADAIVHVYEKKGGTLLQELTSVQTTAFETVESLPVKGVPLDL